MIVLVAGCLVLFMVAGAFAIDLGSGRQVEAQAQSAADAGALAGAEAIRGGATGSAVTSAATSIATQDLPGAAVAVTTSPDGQTATVVVSSSSPNGLGNVAGSRALPVSARATASPSYAASTGTVTSPGNVAIYAADTTCDGGLSIGGSLLTTGILSGLLPANNVNVSGATVISNGNLWVNATNFSSNNSTFVYGGPNGCSFSGSNLPSSSTKTASTVAYPYPLTYSSSLTSGLTCPATYVALVVGSLSPGRYCATSSITLTLCGSVSLANVSLIAPTITVLSCPALGSVSQWTPYASGYPLAWATGAGGLTINFPISDTQLQNLSGVLCASAGPIDLSAGTISGSGLIEGQQVEIDTVNFGSFAGTGASATATTSTTSTGPSSLTG